MAAAVVELNALSNAVGASSQDEHLSHEEWSRVKKEGGIIAWASKGIVCRRTMCVGRECVDRATCGLRHVTSLCTP